MEFTGVLFAAVLITSFYFVPTIVAISRRHVNALPIFLTNLYLGWTGIGWIAAMIWTAYAPPVEGAEAGEVPESRRKKLHYFFYAIGALLVVAVLIAFLMPPSRVSDGTRMQAPRMPGSSFMPKAPAMKEGVPVPADEIFGE